jgi:hypothetical protein
VAFAPPFLSLAVMRKQFYEKALPTRGVYCAAGIKAGKSVQHRFAETVDALIQHTEELKDEGYNVYVAPNSFQGYSRKASDAVFARSFFVDLDVNHGAVCYDSKDAALSALGAFVTEHELPPPVRVDSGTGIQAFWLFDADVPASEWQPYAEKFKDYCIEHGLLIDASVTADAARIMRCPDTYNYKTDPPNLARLLDEEIEQYDFEMFKDFLGEIDVTPSLKAILADVPKGLDDDTAAFKDNYAYYFEDIATQSLEGTGCNQIKYILENATTLAEPLWYAGLSVAVRCVDGEEAIHLMSEDHPGYSRKETERKAQQSLKNASWAHSCKSFEKENPGVCNGCPHKGRLRSGSPIDLGRRFEEAQPTTAPATEAPAQDASGVTQNPQEVLVFPDYLRPFVRGRNGGVYHIPPADEDGEREEPVCLTANDLYPIKRMRAGVDGECLLMRHVFPKDPPNEFLLPLKFIYAFDMLKKILGENGVNFHVSLTQRMFEYLSKWDVYLQHKERAEIMRAQMGWTETKDAFVFGDREISVNGEERNAAISPMIKNVAKLVRRVGSYDVWKQSVQLLNEPGLELHALGLLQGFGSPLMPWAPTPGVSFCFQSGDSGVGKTGALYAGLSVFSDPVNTGLLEGNATENAYIGRYLALKNILFGIDETSNIDVELLCKVLHRISQGKAKLRMQSSVNAERELEMTASLQASMTSNHSMYDKLYAHKTSPAGEVARLVELQMKKPQQMIDDETYGSKIFQPLKSNYGWAGPEFIQHIYKKGLENVQPVLNRWIERFMKDYGGSSEYRFYHNGIAACFAGGELANEAGIINFDLERIYSVVLLHMIQIRDKTVKSVHIDYKALITEFYYNNLTSFLIFNDDKLMSEPYGKELVGRIESSTQRMYVSKSVFKKFLSTKQISTREFETSLEKEKLLIGTEKRRLSTGWKAGTGATPPINVYVFASVLDTTQKSEDDE